MTARVEALAKPIFTQGDGEAIDYGRALKICRAAPKVSQQQVARKARITASYLSLIESGRRIPSLPTLERVCKAMGVPAHLVMLLAAGPGDIPGSQRKRLADVALSLLDLLAGPLAGRSRR